MAQRLGLVLGWLAAMAPSLAGAQTIGGQTAPKADGAAALDLASVRKLEQQLAAAGFSPGPVDGRFDERTQRAVREYQRVKGLEPTGLLDPETQASLLAEADGVTKGGDARKAGPAPRPRR
jgi:peptidoglycan hydrolase-like protein with peptidoglycan-binding domain